MADDYKNFLASKEIHVKSHGFEVKEDKINPKLFPFQNAIIRVALRKGRYDVFAACGLGKAPMALEIGTQILRRENKPILMLTPLAVSYQMMIEAEKFGYDAQIISEQSQAKKTINIINYGKLHKIDPKEYVCVLCDESSIMKSMNGATKQVLINSFNQTPYRFGFTATPAPNDYMELGNQAEFLSIMRRVEMLATFFTHDGGDTAQWSLRGHARKAFWRWLAGWSCMIRKPGDIGFSNAGYDLPPINLVRHIIDTGDDPLPGWLIPMPAKTIKDQRAVKRKTIEERVSKVKEIVKQTEDRPFVVWCELNDEGDMLEKELGWEQIAGKDEDEEKERKLIAFTKGEIRGVISKSKITGYGMNWFHCADTCFMSVSHSHEMLYQAISRFHRFGQKRQVNVHQILVDKEILVLENLERKEKQSDAMALGIIEHMAEMMKAEMGKATRQKDEYAPKVTMVLPEWVKSESTH